MSSSVISQQSLGLATETQSGLVGTGTQSFSGDKTFAGAYTVRAIQQVGVPNIGTHAGYLILAKAYVSGLQEVSEITGTFLLSRGGTGTGNRGDTYTVVSRSAYNGEGLTVQVSVAGNRFFVRTVKVTYQGTIYHAIETTVTGGEPNNGISFQGVIKNATPIYVDATYVSSISAFGNFTILENGILQKPQTPSFSGSFSTYTSNTSNYNPNLATSFNVGFAVNAGQSRITVPVAGKYFVQAQQLVNTVGTSVYLHIRKNSNTVRYAYSNNDDTYDMNVSAMVDCAANDYIDFYYSGTTTYSWADPHSGVICYLIG
jgi:hypothetical protein